MIARAHPRRKSPPRAGWRSSVVALALALALGAGFSALSAAQAPPASEVPTTARSDVAAPRARIVLVLPLESASYARAADAVKAGFLAAAAAAQEKPLVIGHGDSDVVGAFVKATESGARVIVGPLVRDDLRSVATAAAELPTIVALNALDDGAVLPANMYSLALTVDSDARQLARRARSVGAQTVAVIVSDSSLQKRFASAFNAEWILAGGAAPSLIHFDRAPEALALLKRALAKAPPDAALLALDSADAALVKPYLGTIAAYAGSQVNDRQPREVRRDLDDLVFVDIPWLADPDGAAFAGYARPQLPNATLDRLYALGIDAFRVAQAFEDGPIARLEFDGATGRLTLDASRQFVREGRLLQYRSGEIASPDGR